MNWVLALSILFMSSLGGTYLHGKASRLMDIFGRSSFERAATRRGHIVFRDMGNAVSSEEIISSDKQTKKT